MLQFETQLKQLKHEVLVEVVKLARENNVKKKELDKIPHKIIKGDKARYRCCVYKEREVIAERARIALDLNPSGENKKVNVENINIKNDEQIIYVLEAACDSCPINDFTVTDLCRGCLAHRCKEACKFDAISYINGRAYIDQDKCRACGACKKACQYDAISEMIRPCKSVCPTGALDIDKETSKATIHEEKCVSCGACMSACPFGAISDRSLIAPVARLLEKKEKNIYAIVAPAITGQVPNIITYGQIRNAIKTLGFKEMYEAACGADAVTVHEANEFIERMEDGDNMMTNSCCPGFLSYIETMFPEMSDKISHTVSPMIATGRYIKNIDPESVVVFIGPCTAKKREAVRKDVKGAIDYVLTFEEMMALFEGFGIELAKCQNEEKDGASIFGRGFGASGGLTKAIENYIADKGVNVDFKPVKVSGGKEAKKVLTLSKVNKYSGNFIEGMMCEGGCINGAGKFVSMTKAKTPFDKKNSQSKIKTVLSNEMLSEYEKLDLERNL
ncbi:4Fe-4S dicluster domain-containing protein [Peptacetobacter sp.]|uniref:4Fe-4S dicluster domain-containing protein n=1 Tax=Peptacetobacter sp. TaxID=2991975 RepID=UPI002612DD66|nr:4Fe-4S dicluster domain-containing protein [Peptacetobacter sp.]